MTRRRTSMPAIPSGATVQGLILPSGLVGAGLPAKAVGGLVGAKGRARAKPAAAPAPSREIPAIGPETAVLALDPSSTCTGWALLDGRDRLIRFGVIRPVGDAVTRIDAMAAALRELLAMCRPDPCVMEWASGKQARRVKGRAAGLATMGQAQGDMRRVIINEGYRAVLVTAEAWTHGARKAIRARPIELAYPAYRAWRVSGRDSGRDCADAIGVGLYAIGVGRLRAKGASR